jgi:hypothetical protein
MRVRTFLPLAVLAVAAAAQSGMASERAKGRAEAPVRLALDQRCAAATAERLAACLNDCKDRPDDEVRDCQRLCKEGHAAAKSACPSEPGRIFAPTPPAQKPAPPRLPG